MARRHNKKGKIIKNLTEFVSYVDFRLPPIALESKVINLCEKLDSFYSGYPKQPKKQKPSDLVKGAFYAARQECRSNPDWRSQVANSAREVLYPLLSEGMSCNNLIKLFRKYTIYETQREKITNKEFLETFYNLNKIYHKLTDLAHHGTNLNRKGFSEEEFTNFSDDDFENLIKDFIIVLERVFTLQQIYIHTIIDLIVQKNKKKGIKNDLDLILNANLDARQYFYYKADEHWLGWLWRNEFLNVIKQKAEVPTGYRMPEVNYLIRMTEKVPAEVVNILLAIPVSAETFNPEVVDSFLWICSILPAEQLVRVVQKIRDERWIPLMDVFNQWGFEYEKMFKTLADAKRYKELLILTEVVLSVRTKEEIEKSPNRTATDNPFYFDDLSDIRVFEHLANVPDKYTEQALLLSSKAMTEIIGLWGKEDERKEKKVFKVYDKFLLADVDFFTLELNQKEHLSSQEDIRELAATIKVLVQRLFSERCNNSEEARAIYGKYIQPLPDSQAMWRLRLFVLSLSPEIFKDELKKSFFRLFEIEYYNEIMYGTEYLETLRKGFSVLSEKDKQAYVTQVIKYFSQECEDKEKQDGYIRDGSKILSMILPYLDDNPELKKQVKDARFELYSNYQPKPIFGEIQGGFVAPRGPITQEEFGLIPVADIAQKFRNEWTPEKLAQQNTGDDFLNPVNAEGVEQLLQNDIPKRFQNYIDNAILFFDHDKLDPHYTYSFLRGIQKAIANNKETVSKINWDGLIKLLVEIKEEVEREPFSSGYRKQNLFDTWLAGWDDVYSSIADVMKELLKEQDGSVIIDFTNYRSQLFGILKYLLSYPDPTPEDEQIETAEMKIKAPSDSDYTVGDPFTMAINSVRGRAFEAFVLFVYQDSKKFKKENKVKISDDVKELYENVLEKENTRALMFMFGYYLSTFYFLDKGWFQKLLPKIFPENLEKKYLYIAAWEGYLSNKLLNERMFFDPEIQKLYERGLTLKDAEYPNQKHFTKPDEGIGVHFALAYMHSQNFGFEHPLFEKFWEKGIVNSHAHFISFIGHSLISSDENRLPEAIKGVKVKERIRALWDWMLGNYKNSQPFVEFGSWINLEKNIFEPTWLAERVKKTLEKTKGVLKGRGRNLTKSIVQLTKEAPKDTLEIARWYLLEGSVRGGESRRFLYLEGEWFDAFKILYDNPETKSGTCTLINELIHEGRSPFWGLGKIVNNGS